MAQCERHPELQTILLRIHGTPVNTFKIGSSRQGLRVPAGLFNLAEDTFRFTITNFYRSFAVCQFQVSIGVRHLRHFADAPY
jgi:hypothetical protein